ncbi:MAG: hypothetical protein WAK26_07445 [Terracidiphilus sp.]
MKASSTLLAVFLVAGAAATAQVVPAVEGPTGLPISGSLHYGLLYTQTAQFYGGATGTVQRGVASGELAYANSNSERPFAMTYTGGDIFNISGEPEGTGVFQHMLVSQGLRKRAWTLNLMDDVSYLPQAPVSGFSGIPGVGGLPSPPTPPAQPILTQETRSIFNTVSPDVARTIGHETSVNFGGRYTILRFPDGNGLDTDSVEANGQITRRLDARNSLTGRYVYGYTSFPGYSALTMDTDSALFGYQRIWNRKFKTSVSAGPEWVQSSISSVVPPSTNLTINANANYDLRSTSAGVNYDRATTGAAGEATEVGIHSDDVNGSITQLFGRNVKLSASGAYMRTEGLAVLFDQNVVTNAEFGEVSAMRRLSRYFTVTANYTVIQQSSNFGLGPNVVSGLSQVLGFSIAYSPRDINLKK